MDILIIEIIIHESYFEMEVAKIVSFAKSIIDKTWILKSTVYFKMEARRWDQSLKVDLLAQSMISNCYF